MTVVQNLGRGVWSDGWLKWARPALSPDGGPANQVVLDFDYNDKPPEWSARATELFLAWLGGGDAGESFKKWLSERETGEK